MDCRALGLFRNQCLFFIGEFNFLERVLERRLVLDHVKQIWLLTEMLSDIMTTDFRAHDGIPLTPGCYGNTAPSQSCFSFFFNPWVISPWQTSQSTAPQLRNSFTQQHHVRREIWTWMIYSDWLKRSHDSEVVLFVKTSAGCGQNNGSTYFLR